ncbi:MAG: Gldg family protein [Theionarchaea archaeon]|nr:Gldg family protein [Theionarchaea archaeon]
MAIVCCFICLLVCLLPTEISSEKQRRLLIDEYHASAKASKFSELVAELEKEGFSIELLEERIDPLTLSKENYDALVLFAPRNEYSDEEITTIRTFVEEGGGLIMFSDGGDRMRELGITRAINQVSTMFGIQFNQDEVNDPVDQLRALDSNPIIRVFASHPVTEGVETIAFLWGCSLTLKPPAIPLAFGNPTSYANEKKGKEVVVLAAAESGRGRVVAMGDYDFLVAIEDMSYLSYEDDRRLALNMFMWAAQPYIPKVDTSEPDALASQGYDLFSQGEYTSAKDAFEKALDSYKDLGIETRVSDMEDPIAQCEKGIEAGMSYINGTERYGERDYEKALEQFKNSKTLYDEINDAAGSQKAQDMIDACMKAVDADIALKEGIEYLELQDYESAKASFEKALALYRDLGDEERIRECEEWISTCEQEQEQEQEKGGEQQEQQEEPEVDGPCLGTLILAGLIVTGIFVGMRKK